MQDMSVVSSGPYERFFEQDGVRYHHILNSETGVPANSGVEQVTIITAESMHADALSTACFVLGIARGMTLVEAAPNTEALFIDDSRNIYTSTGASAFFELTDARYSIVEKQYTDDMLKIDE
jgi:thiamine biosynthesis lipoprotein